MSVEMNADWVNEHVARLASKTPEFAAIAADVEATAKTIAAKGSDSGEFVKSIKTKKVKTRKGITDYIVYSDHKNALGIEYGHLAGKRDTPDREFVPGKHAFTKAVKKVKRS